MNIKSGMILNEHYTYKLDTTVQQFWFAKGRKGGVLELIHANVYNKSANSITALYFLLRSHSKITRFKYDATLETKTVNHYHAEIFLDDGDELGVEMDGGAVGDEVEVSAQWIYNQDTDFIEGGIH